MGGLLQLELLRCIGGCFFFGMLTLPQVRGQMGVGHLQLAGLGVDLSHLKEDGGRFESTAGMDVNVSRWFR